ncbi:unnamed protein product [Ranitomeya imitator]|uniref:Serine-threonine/tyrosine-protein kinase catalytic domain-containing protein n=2 Tax=Ranitomeya imitator TaxID=111125 RepID=A0ABN9LIV5_9NEOB|nr:unnamed protein product [Ranitomeya imitator]
MRWCWQKNPKNRPSFIQILESIKDELQPSFQQLSFFYNTHHKRKESNEVSDLEQEQTQKTLLENTPPSASSFSNFASLYKVEKDHALSAINAKKSPSAKKNIYHMNGNAKH